MVDLTLAMAGPLCTQRLGELGADVVKIEAPNGGDFSRRATMAGIEAFGDAVPYVTLNRNKRSLVLDLKTAEGNAIMHRLVAKADVVVQNFRPGAATRLGIDFDQLKVVKPDLVYVSISGYGDSGPMAGLPGQDLLVQSFTGLTFNGGVDNALPHASPVYLVDMAASHLACEAALAGLVARAAGKGASEFKVSLMGAAMETQIQEITASLWADKSNRRSQTPQVSIWMEPPYGIYETAAGYLSIAQADLDKLGDLLSLPELSEFKRARPPEEDQVAVNAWRDRIYASVQQRLREKTAADWNQLLSTEGLWCAVVNDYQHFLVHEQTQANLVTIDHPRAGPYCTVAPAIHQVGAEAPALRAAPAYGADTVAVLEELGYEPAEIEGLLRSGKAIARAEA